MAKQKQDFFSQFDEWWQEIGPASRSSLDVDTARLSFVAGCRVVAKSQPAADAGSQSKPAARTTSLRLVRQKYRFRCGRWRITVHASNVDEAKEKALEDLNRRAEKFMTTAPRGGWHLTLMKDDRS